MAKLEKMHGPVDAMVKSPDRIPELVSGNLREVDGSIRYKVGSVAGLITIECRRRRTKQDVTWLEQIASKRDKIGANHTIAVSWKGFSAPAIDYARQCGIELRVLATTPAELVTSRAWIGSKEAPTAEYQYVNIDGRRLGSATVAYEESVGGFTLLAGPVRRRSDRSSPTE